MNSQKTHRFPTHPAKKPSENTVWLYGYHAVTAALKNDKRTVLRLLTTKETAKELEAQRIVSDAPLQIVPRADFNKYLPENAVHQGIAALVRKLPVVAVEDLNLRTGGVIVVLDQVTDPHNVGAVLRSAAAFDALAVVTTQNNAPEETGTLAKSACGALETVPLIYVSNLARTLEYFQKNGYWCVGLDGHADTTMHETDLPEKCVLVMGSEGYGLRRLTVEKCDYAVKLPISDKMESLNVSNAAAVALYECALQKTKKKIAK